MKYPYLDKIQKNGDVKKLPQQELPLLCFVQLGRGGAYGGFAPCADSAAG